MRIALVTTSYPPQIGGAEVHTASLASALARRGIEVEVLTQSPTLGRPAVGVEHGVTVRRWPGWSPVPSAPLSPGLAVFVRRRGSSYDLLHAVNYHTPSPLLAGLAGRGPALVCTPLYHGAGGSRLTTAAHRPYRLLGRYVLARCQAVVALSYAERELLGRDFPVLAPVVIPCGLPERTAEAAEIRAGEPDGQPEVLSVGRLVGYKRVDIAIRAVGRLTDVRMEVVGTGPETEALGRLVSELELAGRVRLTGVLADADLAHRYARASVLVALSRYESFGLTVLEALAVGLPVVASDIPAHRELGRFDEHGALRLVEEPATAAAVAEAIGRAIERGRLPASTQVPTWDQVAGRHEELYREATR